MNGNRLYRDPNYWQTGDVITENKMNNFEDALFAVADEIVTAAGRDNHNEEITLKERLNLINETFTDGIKGLNNNINTINSNIRNANDSIENINSNIESINDNINNITINPDDLSLEQDEDGLVYITFRGIRSSVGIPLAGGSGGGGSSTNAVMTITNNTGWMSKTLPQDDNTNCNVSFTWSSTEDGVSTGSGTLTIVVNDVIKSIQNIEQGAKEIDIYPYLFIGTNNVILRLTDIYGTLKLIRFNVTLVQMRITSSFNTSVPFESDFTFNYTPIGSSSKTVHFVIDGVEAITAQITANNIQQQQLIPAQLHGAHTLEVWFSSVFNGNSVDSNHLFYEFISIEEDNNKPIIASSFNLTTVKQYTNIIVPYQVYIPNSATAEVKIYIDGVLNTTTTVDRTEQYYSFRAIRAGTTTIDISSGNVSKIFTLTVTPSDIVINPESEGLELYLNAEGRSNGETDRDKWIYNDITATLTGFNWRVNGWLTDNDGVPILRVSDDARVVIPFKLFSVPMYNTGKTIEIEFATREVSDYSAEVVKCWHEYTTTVEVDDEENPGQTKEIEVVNTNGLKITPQQVIFKNYTDSISTVYKDNEHIRLTITIGEQGELSDSRLMLIYINGIMSRAEQYTSGSSFAQLSPSNIIIGSNDCGIDIYNIRVYNHDLNRRQVLNNWIADTQLGTLLTDRYTHNDIYDPDVSDITTATVPKDLPYFILNALELPQYKGDVKTISGSYIDPVNNSKSFTFENCEINVQGTSSAPYFRKNYDMKFKGGFITSTGTVNNYALRQDSIPFNRFVLKADVASSESTNNTGLVMFYNDTCPYKTPEMLANNKVRWGIEGVPIAVFWYDTANDTTQFMGKYNFNLPKRAPAPYGYGEDDTLESWEVERNNSANVKFQDNDFTTMARKEDGSMYPAWYDDFEARFPSDEWRDITKLNTFLTFVKSTDRTTATNEDLDESITYSFDSTRTIDDYSSDNSYDVETQTLEGGAPQYNITFHKDTPAYRLSKFRAEFPNYAEVDSFVFYYLFTEMFTMIDSRAKNMFIGFNGSETDNVLGRKATAQPYDMDTAVGTNNSGRLMFGYSLEDTDTVSGLIAGDSTEKDAPVYNAQDSVLWMNVRDAFKANIGVMYTSLRTGSEVWSYDKLEKRYEDHQAKWPEAMFNEDAWIKYIYPLLYAVTKDSNNNLIRTKEYLPMLQGSKTEQRKWWLYNRFRYMDSKFTTGDAIKNQITMRVFHSGTLTITPAIDMYAAVRWGAGTTADVRRTTANHSVSFTYSPGTGVQEMETLIDSGDMLTDLGDLSGLYPNELKFSKAVRLKNLKIGSNVTGYSNPNLTELDVQNSSLLESIDCRNCPNLKTNIYLEGSPRLKEAYFEGTGITGVDLVDGGAIETLHLPSTINTLTLLNLDKLTDLIIPSYSGIQRLMLANISNSLVNPVTVLAAMPTGAAVNIQGLNLEMTDNTEIEAFLDELDRMTGVTRDRNTDGAWIYHPYDTAQTSVAGQIHTALLTGEQVSQYTARYPYILFDADSITSELKYYNYDGSELLYTETVNKNGNGTWNGAPTRASTAQYDFTFVGWSTNKDDTEAESNATKNLLGNRNVYAVYSRTIRKYTVTFVRDSADGGGTLQTVNNVPYGSDAAYTGATPTTTKGSVDDYPFTGWNPRPINITGNTTCYAVFDSPLELSEITDSWDEIISACEDGTYATKYKVGNYKALDLGTEGIVNMQIVAKNKDPLANGSGNAPLTWISMEMLSSTHRMNPDTAYNNKSVPSFTASGNTWTSQNRYTISKAKATWTLTATSTGTVTITYNTSNGYLGRNKITTLKVNGTAVATNYSNTNAATHTVTVSVGDEVVVYCEYDLLDASYNYYATITFSSTGTFTTASSIENADTRDTSSPVSGTGMIGGWENTELRTYLKNTIKPLIPSTVRNAIKEVTKYTFIYNASSIAINNMATTDDVWIPSVREVFGNYGNESNAPYYNLAFPDNASRIKNFNGSAGDWWLRSASNNTRGYNVDAMGGQSNYSSVTIWRGVVLGFCL